MLSSVLCYPHTGSDHQGLTCASTVYWHLFWRWYSVLALILELVLCTVTYSGGGTLYCHLFWRWYSVPAVSGCHNDGTLCKVQNVTKIPNCNAPDAFLRSKCNKAHFRPWLRHRPCSGRLRRTQTPSWLGRDISLPLPTAQRLDWYHHHFSFYKLSACLCVLQLHCVVSAISYYAICSCYVLIDHITGLIRPSCTKIGVIVPQGGSNQHANFLLEKVKG